VCSSDLARRSSVIRELLRGRPGRGREGLGGWHAADERLVKSTLVLTLTSLDVANADPDFGLWTLALGLLYSTAFCLVVL